MVDIVEHVTDLVSPLVKDLGFELVRVTYGGGRRTTLQIMAERPDGTMNVDDCARLSRELSAFLDVEDPIQGEFVLEVSSPGVDRPLTREKDFIRWLGFDAKVELKDIVGDRRRFRGRLVAFEDGKITMTVDNEDVNISFEDVNKAKLVLTDDLLRYMSDKRQQS